LVVAVVITPCVLFGLVGAGDDDDCETLSTSALIGALITACCELPGIGVVALLVERVGRRPSIGGAFSVTTVCFAVLAFACTTQALRTAMAAVARGTIIGAFQLLVIYTPEFYTTNVRSTGMACMSAASRVGATLAPLVAQWTRRVHFTASLAAFGSVALLSALLAFALPYEPTGRALRDARSPSTAALASSSSGARVPDLTPPERATLLHG
jgi:hypothetical protein